MSTAQEQAWPDYVAWEMSVGRQLRTDHITHKELLQARARGVSAAESHRYTKAMTLIGRRLTAAFPMQSSDNERAFEDAATQTTGPLIEVGGPTPSYAPPLTAVDNVAELIGRKGFVLNKSPNVADVDLMGDAKQMPFANGTLGIVMASCLHHGARVNFFEEAERVLEPGGVLAYQTGRDLDIDHVLALGFNVISYTQNINTYFTMEDGTSIDDRTWSFAAQKPNV